VSVKAIWSKCAWCEEEATFAGDDPEEEWATSGWLIHLSEDGGEKEFCSLSCAISAL